MRPTLLRSGLCALALLVTLTACGAKTANDANGAGGPAEVGVVVAATQSAQLTAELSGRTSAYLVSEVRPQVSGVVKARLFKEGGYVKAGEPLYQIDPATYRASLQSAEAGLAQAQAALTTAKLKADRYKELVAIDAISRQDNDDAQAAWRQAEANVAAQAAAVQQAKINLDYTRVLAPISGRIGKSSVTPGALVTASQATALATVQDLSKIYVDVTQSAADLIKLKRELAKGQLGQPSTAAVTLILDDGTTYPTPGELQFSDVTVDPGTGSVGLRAVFPNPNGALLPGLFVRARLNTGVDPSAILIPQAAVSRDAKGQATIYVVGADNKAQQRIIAVSQTVGDQWLVTGGLKAGEKVVVEGLQKIRQPGETVKPVVIAARR